MLRTGFGITYFPIPHSAGNMIGLQVPYAITQNFSTETNPLNYSTLRTIATRSSRSRRFSRGPPRS